MIPLHKGHRYTAPPVFKPAKDVETIPDEHVVSYGLTVLFSAWIKQQRTAEKDVEDKDKDQFTPLEEAYLNHSKRYGCVLPPSRQHCPTAEGLPKLMEADIAIEPSPLHFSTIQSTLDIAACSALPWAMQSSNSKQSVPPLAMAFLALHHDKVNIYQAYLEQDVVWELYLKMAQILESIWAPWHRVTEENRSSSGHQLLPAAREGHAMDSVVGAAVAQNAADVDAKYQKALQSIWKTVLDVAGVPVPGEDDTGKSKTTIKLAPGVLNATRQLFKVSASYFLRYLMI